MQCGSVGFKISLVNQNLLTCRALSPETGNLIEALLHSRVNQYITHFLDKKGGSLTVQGTSPEVFTGTNLKQLIKTYYNQIKGIDPADEIPVGVLQFPNHSISIRWKN